MKKIISLIIVSISIIALTYLLVPSTAVAFHCDPNRPNQIHNPNVPAGVDPNTVPCIDGPSPASTIAVNPPTGKGYSNLGSFVSNLLVLAFGVAILIVLIMLIWGAFEWILSGGDKEAVGKARGRIINALIGLGVLAIAFALARLAGQFLGFDITKSIPIPAPQ